MKLKKYPWEMGTRLANEVQVRNLKAATEHITILSDIIGKENHGGSFEEVKLRILQILTIVNRATYYAGADPNKLFNLNIELINKIIKTGTQQNLLSLAKNATRKFISLIPDKNFPESRKVQKAIRLISRHYTTNISRNRIAEMVGCSPSHLSRMFSRVTGRMFKEYILKTRIDRAKELLLKNHCSITSVAFRVGYKDPNYFVVVFKRVVGVTPSQYRKNPAKNRSIFP